MKILYFAWVREYVGKSEETLALPKTLITVSDLIEFLSEKDGGYREAFKDPSRLRAAINQTFVPLDHNLKGGEEVAFFPPVTGG
ncbi:MAG: molybdopterin converting factor subunit 1 [Sphingomonadales bacterium]